jgi:hypothetical protein
VTRTAKLVQLTGGLGMVVGAALIPTAPAPYGTLVLVLGALLYAGGRIALWLMRD